MANEKRLIKLMHSFENKCNSIVPDKNGLAEFLIANDVELVVHAKWEEIGVADYKCSRCGFSFTSGDPISMFQYCRCGAKMDGGNDE